MARSGLFFCVFFTERKLSVGANTVTLAMNIEHQIHYATTVNKAPAEMVMIDDNSSGVRNDGSDCDSGFGSGCGSGVGSGGVLWHVGAFMMANIASRAEAARIYETPRE